MRILYVLFLFAVVTSLPFKLAFAGAESMAYGINNYESASPACYPSSDDLNYAIQWATKWDDVLEDWKDIGQWNTSIRRSNGDVDWYDFTDTSEDGEDDDSYDGADWGDIGFFYGHGMCKLDDGGTGCSTSTFDAYQIKIGQKDTGTGWTCHPRTDHHIELGDEDANMFFLRSCKSGQYDVWQEGGFDHTASNGTYFAIWSGFHGKSKGFPVVFSTLSGYMNNSKNDNAGTNWITYFTKKIGGDQLCAVTIVFATNEDDYIEDAGLRDWHSGDVGSNSGDGDYFYIDDCEPFDNSGDQLP